MDEFERKKTFNISRNFLTDTPAKIARKYFCIFFCFRTFEAFFLFSEKKLVFFCCGGRWGEGVLSASLALVQVLTLGTYLQILETLLQTMEVNEILETLLQTMEVNEILETLLQILETLLRTLETQFQTLGVPLSALYIYVQI